MTKDEALKLALEAVSILKPANWLDAELQIQAWEAIKEALAQPAQEPVATSAADHIAGEIGYCQFHAAVPNGSNLYTTPPAAQPQEPRNFCPRCGKRTADLTVIHTCTPPEGGHQ